MSACSLNPDFNLAQVAPVVEPVLLEAVPFHAQEAHHCGPASLLSQLEAAGTETDYRTIVNRVYVPGLEGSLQVEMLAAARSFGHIAYTPPAEPQTTVLEVAAGRPVLVLLNLGLPKRPVWHYALVVGFDPQRNELILHSGQQPRSRQKAGAWLRRWDWAGRWSMVLLEPGDWPASAERERILKSFSAFEQTASARRAEVAWRTALDHWPKEPIAWLGLGNALQRQKQGAAAQAAFRRALEIDPDSLPARLNLAYSLAESGQACAAIAELGQDPGENHLLHGNFEELLSSLGSECVAASP